MDNTDFTPNKQTDFGPFTPQELERFVTWLTAKKYSFEIIKDQAAENAFTMNDGRNAVTRADLRTEVYLAQIFTVRVESLSAEQVHEINQHFKLIEVVPSRFQGDEKVIPFESESELNTRLAKSARQKRFWAAVIFIFMVIPMLVGIVQNLRR